MHLHHSLRKLELALHDFGVFEVCLLDILQIEMQIKSPHSRITLADI